MLLAFAYEFNVGRLDAYTDVAPKVNQGVASMC